jgi:hypothetical protein
MLRSKHLQVSAPIFKVLEGGFVRALIGFLFLPQFVYSHGVPGDTIDHKVRMVFDSRYVEIRSSLDLPIGIALELRNKLDANGDYRITPDEQKRLLPFFYRTGSPVSLKIDQKALTLAPLYTAELRLAQYTNLETRGALHISWFAYTPAGITKDSSVEFTHQFWPNAIIASQVELIGRDGMTFAAGNSQERLFQPRQERSFKFRVLSGIKSTATSPSNEASRKEDLSERMVPENAALLAEELTQRYPYILPGRQWDQAVTLHRRLRMEIQNFKAAGTGKARAVALNTLDLTSASFVALLKECKPVVNIDLDDISRLKESSKVIELPGDAGALLLRIKRGKGIHQGRIYPHSFAIREFIEPMDTGLIEKGITWLLIRLTEVPVDPVRLKFSLRTEEGSVYIAPVRVKSPTPARLKFTVLSDDTGEPTPAMVSLIWKTCNLDRRPATALDIVPQFNGQGNQTNLRHTNLHGKRKGTFWIVPEPFEMELPPGEWEVVVRHGAEHSVVHDSFTLKPGEHGVKTYRPKRWINMPEKGWYSGDDHVHCQIMSDSDARNLLAYAEAEDVHLANVVKMGDIHRTFFQQRGFGKDYRVSNGRNVLSPGQECPRTHQQLGHTLAMNVKAFVRDTDKYYLYDTVFDEVHRQGGLSGYAHVNRDLFFVHRDLSLNIPRGKVDFAEILQFGMLGTDLYYEFLNLGYRLTASAGSDLPWGGTLGEVRVYAHLGEQPFSADHWFEAFSQGHTFVSNGPMLELEVEGAGPGDTLKLDRDRPVRVRGRLRVDPDLGGASRLELIAHGEVVEIVNASGVGQGELVMDIAVPVKGGIWLALKGIGADGSVAHSTPVYIIRKGQRFWKMTEVESLIEKQLSRLSEIEVMVAHAHEAVDNGVAAALTEILELAREGDALLERVELVKGIYRNLLKTYAQEKKSKAATEQ